MKLWNLPTLDLAKELLGMKLIHIDDDGITSGYIVETEAYLGPEDRAAHSYNNRRTARTEVMYSEAGMVYTYFIYGMHVCFNIVSGPLHKPEAILIRALQPIEGIEKMKERRARAKNEIQLTNGPGKLSKAMGFTLHDNGKKLNEGNIRIEEGMNIVPDEIISGPRIGIQYAEEAVHYPYRFWIKNNPYVSR
ncbi:DNA-3-methyladenine glycosylase [Fictibacillus phosphorivorans]|uniref:Putative 3-methyladenine DNA glycosylase n=1 Tax=Fictibacillus phosphorivorans TaxID=1221500 RepID=A0A160IPB1_9BACL|nr:DNA-3-methyladenine glycosylase [Fictibacillus phosphorivorans]ANC78241.1 3-methyladenine DNA glycosylase [Fictibacillus phosphorivorans]MQR95179.1 DNA-3-methyladenine glycosylase [Fictibacillus phosphorivorans]